MSSNTECLFEILMAKSPLYLQVLMTTCVQVIMTNYLRVCDHLSLGSCDHLSLLKSFKHVSLQNLGDTKEKINLGLTQPNYTLQFCQAWPGHNENAIFSNTCLVIQAITSARVTTMENATFHGELFQIFFRVSYIFSGLMIKKNEDSSQQPRENRQSFSTHSQTLFFKLLIFYTLIT